ncbi:restriction endonuclease subunit S [Streptococcus oralis]|uniref:restriction endonuclease subunit S n=1 Tax=Streptococcus oralis TaxID=1303 RepID=UPI0039C29309
MNILEEIQNCPVEWKELGEVCDTVTDFTAAGSFASNAKNVKYIKETSFAQLVRTTDLKSGFKGNNFVYVDEHAFNYLYRVNLDKESLVMPNVGNCGEIYYIKPENLPYENNVLGPNALLVRSSKENNRYLFHLFQSGQFQNELAKITSNTGQTKYNKTNLKKIRIPIPSLEIQENIVQILDKMTDYVTELTSELTSRKKQYSYYRDKLLSFEDEVYQVEWKKLDEIAENLDSKRKPVAKGGRSLGVYPYYGASGIVDYVDDFIFDGDFLLISEDGANLVVRKTPIAFSITGKTWVNNHAHVLKFDNMINQKFVNYYLNNIDLSPYISGAAQPKLNQQNLNNIKIPYPSLEIQSRIVQVLDNFDTVCHDLNIGLPKEIELRQKQYEYFREKLLTFVAEGEYTESRVE